MKINRINKIKMTIIKKSTNPTSSPTPNPTSTKSVLTKLSDFWLHNFNDGWKRGKRLYNYDINFLKENRKLINWKFVGSGKDKTRSYDIYKRGQKSTYGEITDFTCEFLEEFQNEINWDFVGSGLIKRTHQSYDVGYETFHIVHEYNSECFYKHIIQLPRWFLKKFGHKINRDYWDTVGDGSTVGTNLNGTKNEIQNLATWFLTEYEDYINWELVGSGYEKVNKKNKVYGYSNSEKKYDIYYKHYFQLTRNFKEKFDHKISDKYKNSPTL